MWILVLTDNSSDTNCHLSLSDNTHKVVATRREEDKMCYQMNTSLLKDITQQIIRYKHQILIRVPL